MAKLAIKFDNKKQNLLLPPSLDELVPECRVQLLLLHSLIFPSPCLPIFIFLTTFVKYNLKNLKPCLKIP